VRDRSRARAAPHASAAAPGFAALGVVFAVKLAVVVLGLGRGFELGDEGFFLANLNDPASSPRFFEFYKLLLLLPGPPHFGVVGTRWLRLASELVASFALVAGAFRLLRERLVPGSRVSFASFAGIGLLGVLLSAASRSFSYNDATNFCVYGAVGALLWAASLGTEAGARGRAALAAAGFLVGFQLFVKFPPALLLIPLFAVALALGFPGPARRRLALAFGLGWLAAIALFVAANGGVAPLREKLGVAAEVAALAGYGPLALVAHLVRLEVWTAVDALVAVGAGTVAFLVLRRSARLSADVALASALLAGSGALLGVVVDLHPTFGSAALTAFACAAFLAPLALLFGAAGAGRREPATIGWALLLLVLPLVLYAGTNVPFAWRLPSHALPLFVVASVLVHRLRERGFVWTGRAAVALLVGVSCWVFVRHAVVQPYGLREPLWAQTEPVEGLPGVRVDLASARFLAEVAATFEGAGYRRGDPIVAMDYMPGLVFFLGGHSPGFPFYAFDRAPMNCFNLNRVDHATLPFLILGRPVAPEQRACVEAFDLPGDFEAVRTLRFPYEAVYASFGGSGISHVTIYAPRKRNPSASARSNASRARAGSP